MPFALIVFNNEFFWDETLVNILSETPMPSAVIASHKETLWDETLVNILSETPIPSARDVFFTTLLRKDFNERLL